ncbi:MAG TPA: outer membrane beta-barrel protein [Bryobacteraceae bacterium]|nr:outer membrane beta-barrel protein [Bryobacteraceae bacterium]
MKTVLPILLFVFSCQLRAQSGELWLSGGASLLANGAIGSPSPDGSSSDVQLGNGFRVGFRYGFNSAGHIGHEIQYMYNRTDFIDNTGMILPEVGSAGTAIHQAGYNLLYYKRAAKEESRIRPFATVGFHLSDFVLPPSAGPQQGSSVRPGGNFGGGVKVKISPLFAVRVDVREYVNGKPDWSGLLVHQGGALFQTEVSAGFGVYF